MKRKPAAKGKVRAKGAAKKRTARVSSRKRVKKAEIEEAPLNITYLTQLPEPPQPEIDPLPEPTPSPEPIKIPSDASDEIPPVVSSNVLSALRSRLSFYMGVLAGAAVLHVLVFAVASIVLS